MALEGLKGVVMELEDGAFPLLAGKYMANNIFCNIPTHFHEKVLSPPPMWRRHSLVSSMRCCLVLSLVKMEWSGMIFPLEIVFFPPVILILSWFQIESDQSSYFLCTRNTFLISIAKQVFIILFNIGFFVFVERICWRRMRRSSRSRARPWTTTPTRM